MSATLGRGFALALISGGRARQGETPSRRRARGPSPSSSGTIFNDAEGKRLDA